jgi:hypothetical protein
MRADSSYARTGSDRAREERRICPVGSTQGFRLPFDNLGQTGTSSMPQMVIAGIVF